jgi:hypothetical protein
MTEAEAPEVEWGYPRRAMSQVVYLLAGVLVVLVCIEIAHRRRSRRTRQRPVYHVPATESDSEVAELVREGRKVAAIERYRELHGTDLPTARRAIEDLERQDGRP